MTTSNFDRKIKIQNEQRYKTNQRIKNKRYGWERKEKKKLGFQKLNIWTSKRLLHSWFAGPIILLCHFSSFLHQNDSNMKKKTEERLKGGLKLETKLNEWMKVYILWKCSKNEFDWRISELSHRGWVITMYFGIIFL